MSLTWQDTSEPCQVLTEAALRRLFWVCKPLVYLTLQMILLPLGANKIMSNPRQLLESYDLHPKKSLGQNFLFDPNALQKIASLAELDTEDIVLEVGTGTGSLTKVLAEQAKLVHTFEVDERLQELLYDEFADYPKVVIHWQDILEADLESLVGDQPYKVVANLPYYITSAILRKLLETSHKPTSLTVMMQKQVAERLTAHPPDMSVLTVSVQFYADPKIKMTLKPNVFFPRPDVDSAVVHLKVYPQALVDVPSEALFFEVVRAGFGQKRKQLKNALGSNLGLSADVISQLLAQAQMDGQRRAETLTLAEWANLAQAYAQLK